MERDGTDHPIRFAGGAMTTRPLRIWIDLENSPHVLFFEPVIAALRRRGHHVVVTGRHFCSTLPLARARGLSLRAIGRGYDRGRNGRVKHIFHVWRSLQLRQFARAHRFDVAASHGSRTQASAAASLHIPTWAAQDYEHAYLRDFRGVRCFMVPGVMPEGAFDPAGIPRTVIRHYDGLKEEVYLSSFQSAGDPRAVLGIPDDALLVVFRPMTEHAHYGSDRAYALERGLVERLLTQPKVRMLVLPRTPSQGRRLRRVLNGNGQVRIHAGPLDGPALIDAADLVISGGGTMVREAVTLGVPAISCFEGRLGAVDTFLAQQQRLTVVRRVEDAAALPDVTRQPRGPRRRNPAPLQQVVDAICAVGYGA
jgi:predicted glycosyltransferase